MHTASTRRPLRLGRSRLLASLLTGLLALAGVAAVNVAPASPAAAATACGFASPGTGTYASTLCWIDLSAYDPTDATDGQTITQAIPGGYTMSFTLTVSGAPAHATSLPTWSGSYLGNNGHYTGVAGRPALYQSGSGTTTATLTNVAVTDRNGTPVRGYSLVGADAEATGPGESITWTSSSPITSLTATPSGNGLGNACGGGFTGVGTNTVTCTGSSVSSLTGTAILASTAPTTFSQSMFGTGLEGVAFGVLVSSVQLTKTVVNGFAGDSFGLSIDSSDGSSLATANTNGAASATTGPTTVIVAAGGSKFTFGEAATAGRLSNYTQAWSCTRNGSADAALPTGAAGPQANVTVGIGDAVNCTITNTAKPATLSLTKQAGTPVDVNHDGLVDAGDTIAYSFLVANTGQLSIDGITVTDNKVGAVTCPISSLTPGSSTTCTANAPYVITAADVAAGSVDNTAGASGTPQGTTATVDAAQSSTRTPTTAPAPALSVVKSATPSDSASYRVGQVITYSFVVTNTGNVPVTDIALDDSTFSGSAPLGAIDCPAGSDALAPKAQTVCTAKYTLTQADVDATELTNAATASGTPASGGTVTAPRSSVTIPVDPAPGISLTKTASAPTAEKAGGRVTYGFAVTNTGNVSLSAPVVSESAFSGSAGAPAVGCPAVTFVPGQTVDCTATYVLTQADVDAGTITNTATASATAAAGTDPVSDPSSATVTIAADPELTVVKSASPSAPADFRAGETITYSFVVTNTGNVTISQVGIVEGDFTGSGTLPAATCPAEAASLAPGHQVTCTTEYTVTQADIDAGEVTNTATAEGTPPGTTTPVPSDPSTVTVPQAPKPSASLVKTDDAKSITRAGQVVHYAFTVTNTGNTTLSGIGVREGAFSGHGTLTAPVCPADPATLVPGQSVVCTASYTVVAADLTGKPLTNTATAVLTAPGGRQVLSDPSTARIDDVATVAPAPGTALASTGSSIGWGVGVAALSLVIAGGALLLARRRKSVQ